MRHLAAKGDRGQLIDVLECLVISPKGHDCEIFVLVAYVGFACRVLVAVVSKVDAQIVSVMGLYDLALMDNQKVALTPKQ